MKGFTPARIAPLTGRSAMTVIGGCLAVSLVSVIVAPTLPFNDPTAWLTWSWDIRHGGILDTPRSPSWKPLPVIFMLPWALASPSVVAFAWIVVARAGALAASVFLFRLGARSGGWVGGAIAAILPWLLPPWDRAVVAAACEPMTIALMLAAVESHVDRRPRATLILLSTAALMRPEAAALVAAFAVLWFRREGRAALPLIAALGVIGVALWTIPAAILFGDALQPFGRALVWPRSDGWFGRQIAMNAESPVAFVAILGLVIAGGVIGWQRRDRVVLTALGAASLWFASVVLMQLLGSPHVSRYMLPGTVILTVVAGRGAGGLVGEAARRPRLAALTCIAALAAVTAVAYSNLPKAEAIAQHAYRSRQSWDSARQAFESAGGFERFRACAPLTGSRLVINSEVHGNLPRALGLPAGSVRRRVTAPTVALVSNGRFAGESPTIRGATGRRVLWSSAGWRVVYVAGRTDCGGFTAAGGRAGR